MTLREKQSLFARLVAALILEAVARGFDVTLGECARSEEEAARLRRAGKGIASSLHTIRLAIDVHLFLDGRYLQSTEDHRALGEWWEAQHPLCRWGGRFGDGNHYSVTHGGRR